MKEKKRIILLMIVMIVISTSILSAAAQAEKAPAETGKVPEMVFMSSAAGGTWFPVAVSLTELWAKEFGYQFSIAPGGGTANIIGIEAKEAQLGMTVGTTFIDALKGAAPFNTPVKNIRVIANLTPNVITYFTYKNSGIVRFEDLRGKRVGVKPVHFSAHGINKWITSLHGMSFDDFGRADALEKGESINLLKDGHMDAILWIGNPVDAAVMDASTTRDIRIIELSPAIRDKIRAANPGYVPYVIPKGTYRGIDQDINTLAMPVVLLVSADVPDEVVYNMTKSLAENIPLLAKTDINYTYLSPKDMAFDMGAPIHPGALKYYKEKGLR